MPVTPDAPDVPNAAVSTPAASPPAASYDPVGDEIAELCAHLDAALYRLLTLLRRYDEEELWIQRLRVARFSRTRRGWSSSPSTTRRARWSVSCGRSGARRRPSRSSWTGRRKGRRAAT